jgi:hypothetical protein
MCVSCEVRTSFTYKKYSYLSNRPWRPVGVFTVRHEHHLHMKSKDGRMVSSGMLYRVALVRTDVSEDLSASFIRVTRIGELGTTLVHRFLSPR